MRNETIVAVYDTEQRAAAAVRDLEASGIPSSAIRQHAGQTMRTGSEPLTHQREPGFWASLFGTESDSTRDAAMYDRTLAKGSHVVTVHAESQHMSRAMEIMERHSPVDLEGHEETGVGTTAGARETGAGTAAGTTGRPLGTGMSGAATGTGSATPGRTGTQAERIPLAQEELEVGKRQVAGGKTRIRRYVVETPVEGSVSLREETASVERRPVTSGTAAKDADFSDKVVEVTTRSEEPVVTKKARVTEEVVVNKDVRERVETVHDTVRRQDVEVTRDPREPAERTASNVGQRR